LSAIHDKIPPHATSSNDASQAVFQLITGTASGPELSGEALGNFLEKGEWVNCYFAALGYRVNTNHAAYAEGPYLRDRLAGGPATMMSGQSLPPGSQYYSKAGRTNTTWHDAAYIKLPNGGE
jgi:hypothetical protein